MGPPLLGWFKSSQRTAASLHRCTGSLAARTLVTARSGAHQKSVLIFLEFEIDSLRTTLLIAVLLTVGKVVLRAIL